jgi:perosamine synthetase
VTGRYLAPAGAPIEAGDLLRWIGRCAASDGAAADVRSALSRQVGRAHVDLVCTGRAGLTILLSALESMASDGRDEIILPTYTCYSVAASVVRAGLKPRLVDIDVATLDYDLEKLERADTDRTLAIVVTNLYGIPGNLPAIARFATARGLFLVDDAAQSLGARIGGKASGAWGDAGLYSFDKGKPISAIEGGAIATDDKDLSRAVSERIRTLPLPGVATRLAQVAKVLAYAALLRPRLYAIPNAIPSLKLGQTVYQLEAEHQRIAPSLTALAATMMPRLSVFTQHRVATAARFHAKLAGHQRLTTIRTQPEASPIYLRFPVLARDRASRDAIVAALQRAGIGASGSYPASLADIAALRPHLAGAVDADGGRFVADRIITLPTHPYVTETDVERAVAVIDSLDVARQRTPLGVAVS